MKKLLTAAFVFVGLLTSLVFFTGCQKTNTPPATTDTEVQNQQTGTNVITIKNFAFDPQSLEINAGDEVTWVNEDSPSHTVTIADMFDSGLINSGNSFKFKFDKPGTYEYHCSIHPSMKGSIVVK